MADIQKLEQELRAINKEREQVEKNWRDIEYKERQTEQIAKRRAQPTKRTRDSKTDADDETDGKRLKNDEDDDNNVKQTPKLTSAIVAPGSTESEDAKSSATKPSVVDKKEVTRQRKMFGVLLGTLQQFKNESTRKSDAVARREQLEHKIDAKVKEEQETFVERERRTIQDQKDKVAARKDELKRKQEEKELELLSLKWQVHRGHLSNFIRTEAKPHIYYRPKVAPTAATPTSQNDSDPKKNDSEAKREDE